MPAPKGPAVTGTMAPGVTIAKISTLSDDALDRLLRVKFRQLAHTFPNEVIIKQKKKADKYKAIEKHVPGPTWGVKKNESKLKLENDLADYMAPTMATYNAKDEV
jgi:hypothetical protein